MILTVGNELTSGDVENSNASWLARSLEALGCSVRLVASLPDESRRSRASCGCTAATPTA